MFEDVKIGDQVWSYIDGYGTVIDIIESGYPIAVKFDAYKHCSYFTLEGKRLSSDLNPTLFWDEIKFNIPKKPLPKLKVDTKVLVWNNGMGKKEKRYFKKFNTDRKIICFDYGRTSWSTNGNDEVKWNYWELAEENTVGI